ncbi:MAG TPA: photosynthetic reaction center cytochrome c subunit family protein [Pseudomonadota bacterium]|nr:photosynthetic reaction center cytochrome c subunit family protein [Pseudomonadota bacterium]
MRKPSFISLLSFHRVRRLVLFPLLGTMLLLSGAAASANFKNLQVMPKNVSKAALIAQMNSQVVALGKDCTHCHDPKDPAKETPLKEKARDMMRMVAEINAKWPGTLNRVTCYTCHRGNVKPADKP